MIPASALGPAPLRSLGLVQASCPGCPDCRAVIGLDGAHGLANALARPRRTCPPGDQVCPACGCEGQLYQRASGWRCGDCLGERLFDDLASPPAPARTRVRAAGARPRHPEHQDATATEPEPAEKAEKAEKAVA
jgi:hypothetical protein